MYGLVLRSALPLAVALTVLVTPTYAMTPAPPLRIQIQDQCESTSFNAAIGPRTCIGNGAVTFQQFVSELMQLHFAPQWHFVPAQLQMRVGQSFIATNVGGETHTFTEVQHFGGGFIPFLNNLAGKTTVAPECGQVVGGILVPAGPALASFVPPGGNFTDIETAADVGHPVLYQCCIHPWMNEVLTVNP